MTFSFVENRKNKLLSRGWAVNLIDHVLMPVKHIRFAADLRRLRCACYCVLASSAPSYHSNSKPELPWLQRRLQHQIGEGP